MHIYASWNTQIKLDGGISVQETKGRRAACVSRCVPLFFSWAWVSSGVLHWDGVLSELPGGSQGLTLAGPLPCCVWRRILKGNSSVCESWPFGDWKPKSSSCLELCGGLWDKSFFALDVLWSWQWDKGGEMSGAKTYNFVWGSFKKNNFIIFFSKFYKNPRPYGYLSKEGLEIH